MKSILSAKISKMDIEMMSLPRMTEDDAIKGDHVFDIAGEQAMTVHGFKKHFLKLEESDDAYNGIDSKRIHKQFGKTGYVFWAKNYSRVNLFKKICHLHLVSELKLYFTVDATGPIAG